MKAKWKIEARHAWDAGDALQAGQILCEHLRVAERPGWAVASLDLAARLVPPVPEIEVASTIAKTPARWHEAHEAFQAIRWLTLRETDRLCQSVLILAENTAKVTYNASGSPAPFDADAGWWIAQNVRSIIDRVEDPLFRAEAERILFRAD
jgi:hypothetical protein